MLDQLPLTNVCLHLLVSCLPCLGDPSQQICCTVLSHSSCIPLQNVHSSHRKQCLHLGPFLQSRFTATATELLCPLCLCAMLSWKFCSGYLNSVKFVAGLKLPCITKFFYLIGRQLKTKAMKKVSETASAASYSLVSNSCPLMNLNPQSPRANVEQALPPKSPLSVSPHTEIPLSISSKPLLNLRCRHLPHNHVSAAWGLLHLGSVTNGTTHCSYFLWYLQFLSHMHASPPWASSSHRCLPHWLLVQAHWFAPQFHLVICVVSSSTSLPQISCSRLERLRTNFFRLAIASLFALGKSTNTNFVYWSANTMQKRNPDSDSTLKIPITSVNSLFSFYSAWVSATLGTGVFVILANAHTLHTSSSCPLSLVYSWPHPIDSNDPIVCVTSLHCQILSFTLFDLFSNARTLKNYKKKLFFCC